MMEIEECVIKKRLTHGGAIVKTCHSYFFKVVILSVLRILVLGYTFSLSPVARADDYEECYQILVHDVFNKVTTSWNSDSQANNAARATIFQLNDHDAFKEYSKKYDEAKQKGEEGSGGGSYAWGLVSAEGGGKVNSNNKLTDEEFSTGFKKAKEEYRNSSSAKSSSQQSLASNYATYVADQGIVTAWRDCVTHDRSKEPNLYAYASRDKAGKTLVNVMWVPGVLAGSLPSITINFVTDDDAEGIKVHADKDVQVAQGSGSNFAVSCGTKCDNGFQVSVNGTLKNAAGNATNSFTSTVDVPPLNPPELPQPQEYAPAYPPQPQVPYPQ
jgi:hypothetical protein